jgi:SAM-dependent methyltransferase
VLEDGSIALLRDRLRVGLADDATFDTLYAEPIRARSSQFWTPVAVATRAVQLLAHHGARRVLDVGSGPGKFCLTGACVCPSIEFTGVEHRRHLVDAAYIAGTLLGVKNACFITGDATRLPWSTFDGLYLYNPFAENVCDEDERLDHTVELSLRRYYADVRRVRTALLAASNGTVMVTYHGASGPIPTSYELVHAEHAHSGWLRVWVKRGPDDGQTYYVEDDGDLLVISTATGVTVTKRITARSAAAAP